LLESRKLIKFSFFRLPGKLGVQQVAPLD